MPSRLRQGQETTVCCALVYIGLSVRSNVSLRLSTLATTPLPPRPFFAPFAGAEGCAVFLAI